MLYTSLYGKGVITYTNAGTMSSSIQAQKPHFAITKKTKFPFHHQHKHKVTISPSPQTQADLLFTFPAHDTTL